MQMTTQKDVAAGRSINNYCSGGNVQVAMNMMGLGTPDEHNTVELESNYPYSEGGRSGTGKTKEQQDWENGVRPASRVAPLVPVQADY